MMKTYPCTAPSTIWQYNSGTGLALKIRAKLTSLLPYQQTPWDWKTNSTNRIDIDWTSNKDRDNEEKRKAKRRLKMIEPRPNNNRNTSYHTSYNQSTTLAANFVVKNLIQHEAITLFDEESRSKLLVILS